MRFVELNCPYCGGQLNLHDDRKFAECPYCTHKVMILDDGAVEVNTASTKTDPEFEKLRYTVINNDMEECKFKSDSSCAWFWKGYQELDDYSGIDGDNFKKCEAAWRMSFSKMDSDYFLTDYARLIGACLGKIDDYRLDYDSNPGYTHRLLETICEYVCERFNIEFVSEFYYAVFTGFSKTMNLNETEFDVIFYLISNSLKYETTPETFVAKCIQFEKVTHRFNDESLEHDCKATLGTVGFTIQHILKKGGMAQNSLKPKWTEPTLIARFNQDWNIIESTWSMIHNQCTLMDLDGFRNEVLQSVLSGKPYESDGTKESIEEYEHIEENAPTVAQRMKKERSFTQFFILNGEYYTRSITIKTKEFNGDIRNPHDLQTLESIFEEVFENYVPFGADPDDYYDTFEGTLMVNYDITEYQEALIDFINGYVGVIPSPSKETSKQIQHNSQEAVGASFSTRIEPPGPIQPLNSMDSSNSVEKPPYKRRQIEL